MASQNRSESSTPPAQYSSEARRTANSRAPAQTFPPYNVVPNNGNYHQVGNPNYRQPQQPTSFPPTQPPPSYTANRAFDPNEYNAAAFSNAVVSHGRQQPESQARVMRKANYPDLELKQSTAEDSDRQIARLQEELKEKAAIIHKYRERTKGMNLGIEEEVKPVGSPRIGVAPLPKRGRARQSQGSADFDRPVANSVDEVKGSADFAVQVGCTTISYGTQTEDFNDVDGVGSSRSTQLAVSTIASLPTGKPLKLNFLMKPLTSASPQTRGSSGARTAEVGQVRDGETTKPPDFSDSGRWADDEPLDPRTKKTDTRKDQRHLGRQKFNSV